MSNDDAITNFTQALSPRLGQRAPSESTTVLMFNGSNIPEVAWAGQIIYRYDTQILQVYNGEAWEDVVGGTFGILTFVGPEPPTAQAVGDLWFDTDDKRKLYRAASVGADEIAEGEWELLRDQGIDEALQAATETAEDANAAIQALTELVDNTVAIVDGKIDVFYDTVAPSGASEGDLWFNTATGKAYRHTGAIEGDPWALIQDEDITQALADAQNAQTTADGKITAYYQDDPPASAELGDLWYDTNDLNHPHYWDGDSWESVRDGAIGLAAAQIEEALDLANDAITAAENAEAIADGAVHTFYQATMPTEGTIGDLWFDTDDKQAYRHNGTTFVSVQDQGIADALQAASDAEAAADGKVVAFYQNDAPTSGHKVGDLWYDTNDGNKAYYFSGSSWFPIPIYNANVQDGVMDGETIIGATIVAGNSATSGERIVMRKDGFSGVIEAFSGVSSETPARLDPGPNDGADHVTGGGSSTAGIALYSGSHPTRTVQSSIQMAPGASRGGILLRGEVLCDTKLETHGDVDVKLGDINVTTGDINVITGVIRGADLVYLGSSSVTTVPNVQMNASGFIRRTTHANSSRRYKMDEQDANLDTDAVLALQPKSYLLNPEAFSEDAELPEGRQYGFIAEDAEELGLGWLVVKDDQGRPDQYDYIKHCIALQAVARAQAEKIETLEERVSKLEAAIENLTKES